MQKKRWSDLDPEVRRAIQVAAAAEGMLKIAALVDLARRPASEVRGSKLRWAVAIILVNSMGIVPIVYFIRGRKPSGQRLTGYTAAEGAGS
jgi:hypothetical protein